ncbi:hypothetical protein DXG01_004603 [Tephrocybe rancida]|nr:hypothetical protein DXG01_004603 [Tephrocybe rancida]
MPVLMTLAVPLVLGATSFSSEEKLHLSDSLLDKINAYFYRILEIMPDVDKEALLHDIGDILSKREDASLDHVFDILFDMLGADGDTAVVKQTEDDNQNVECACCFSAFPFVSCRYMARIADSNTTTQEEMVQCPETHLFCSPCMNMHASILLGSHNPDIRCVDQSGCTLPISTSELQRLLSPKMMELWERAQSRRALESARLENLHYCPFCDWACIIEDQLEGKHHVDEAMSAQKASQFLG